MCAVACDSRCANDRTCKSGRMATAMYQAAGPVRKRTEPRARKSSKIRATHAAARTAATEGLLLDGVRYTSDIVVKYGRNKVCTSRSKALVLSVEMGSRIEGGRD